MREQLPGCDHFDHDGAWRIESAVVARCHMEGLAVTISTWLGSNVPFTLRFRGERARTTTIGFTERRVRRTTP